MLRAAAGPADRVQLVDEDDRRGRLLRRARTGRGPGTRPTPTIISMNSDADRWKNGTSASPATARASSVLPVPGGPDSSTPLGIGGAEPPVLLRVAEEVDDLRELLPRPRRCRPRPRTSCAARTPARTAWPGTARSRRCRRARRRPPPRPEEPHQQADEQQGRPEADQQLLPDRRRVRRAGVHRRRPSRSSSSVSPSSAKAGRWVVNSVTSFASPVVRRVLRRRAEARPRWCRRSR